VLILTRKTEQGIVIAGDVVVRVLSIEGERVKLGIDAPRSISVLREELIEEVAGENRQATQHLGSRSLSQHLRQVKPRRQAS
jgi:carbon storage regulator